MCFFPKHSGESWLYVVQEDRDYAQWVLDNVLDPDEEEELCDALKWGIANVPDRL
jgi:hypothetical protein